MDNYDYNERRQFARYEVALTAVMHCAGENGEIKVVSHDIGAKGVGFVCDRPLTIGQTIDLRFRMPDNGEEIVIKGTIVWLRVAAPNKYWAGVVFENENFKPIPIILRNIKNRVNRGNG